MPKDPGKIFSCLPGTFIDVFVKPRQHVKQGQILLVFEAMKMKNRVIVPFDGKIKTLNVSKGENVSKGQLIAEIE